MRTVLEPAVTLWGIKIGLDKTYIRLSKQERTALKRAATIREEVRDRISTSMGLHDFEGSAHYTISVDDLIDGDPYWDDWDINAEECDTCLTGGHA